MSTPATKPATARRSKLWLWFVLAFVIQAGAWTVWFVIASRHKVQEVPLEAGTSNMR